MNQTIPDMPLVAALRTLGEDRTNETRLVYGATSYKRGYLESAILGVRGFGATPLGHAIKAATEDLRTTRGNTAVIILSDGRETDRMAVTAAKQMKEQLGDRLCIYPSEGMATLAENVFLEKVPAPVAAIEPAPAPEPEPVGALLEEDSDGDGVLDDQDECPDTPKGATVNSKGCWTLKGVVLFDFDKYDIKPEAYPLLDEVVTIVKKNPQMEMEMQGHTDNVGSAEYNQGLSERRAQAVMDYLVRNGIDPERLSYRGYGLTRPAASNDTEEGRTQNRRAELRRP
jgi:OOP family OmpA-OmpF porin